MVGGRIAELVKRLYERTQRKQMVWEPTPKHDAFVSPFPKYSVRIEQADIDSTDWYVMSIINDEGVVVDYVSDSALMSSFPGENWREIMGELYEMARRQVLGADEAIDDILDHLQ